MSTKIPRGLPLPAETKRTGRKLESDAVLKPSKENVQRKNAAPKVHKGRYGQEAELREQNQNLTTANEELQRHLTDTQQRVSELELHSSELEKENADVQKNLKNCHVLLVAAKIDPGGRVGEAAEQNEDRRREAMSVSADLLSELSAFGESAAQQRAQLQEIQRSMSELTEARQLMVQERENFSVEAAELEKALLDAEALLNLDTE